MLSQNRGINIGLKMLLLLIVLLGKGAATHGGSPRSAKPPPVLNSLMIGCSQEGAIVILLTAGGGRLEVLPSGMPEPPGEERQPKKYDSALVFRVGSQARNNWDSGKIYLYFSEGFLTYKSYIVDEEQISPEDVFRREIKSGLQHPLNYPDLMEKVHWGEAKRPRWAESDDQVQRLPSVRCGLALDGLPPFAKQNGYNALVLFQNVGSEPLDEEMILTGLPYPFPFPNPILGIRLGREGHKTDHLEAEAFGVYGSKSEKLGGLDVKIAPFRLRPGEATFAWLRIPK